MAASPTVRRRQLGIALERYRKEAGLSRDDAARSLEVSEPTVSRIEGGRTGVRPKTVREMLDLYGVKDAAVRGELEALARSGQERGWWSAYARVLTPGYSTYIGFEDGADRVDSFSSLVIPGLLQTPDYAAAVIQAGGPRLPADEVAQRVQVRVQRQTKLRAGLQFWAVLDEAVVRRVVGGPAAMREQLELLIEASELRNVTMQIVPLDAGAHPGMVGEFTILRFPSDPDVVCAEMPTGTLFIEAEDAQWYNEAFDRLRAQALSPAASVALAESIAGELQ